MRFECIFFYIRLFKYENAAFRASIKVKEGNNNYLKQEQ